uniref:Uncharacterized protein n=1 Tax=Anguilla anguilla TaxID=7936 RepID=A0A0E9QG77_ANGAN
MDYNGYVPWFNQSWLYHAEHLMRAVTVTNAESCWHLITVFVHAL